MVAALIPSIPLALLYNTFSRPVHCGIYRWGIPLGGSGRKGGSMASSDDPSHREGRYDRRELLRRAGAGAVTVGVAGSGFGQAFYGPLRFKGAGSRAISR
jgi:hypothetical protein